jgi:mannose-1-phosphate guanylyltransferase
VVCGPAHAAAVARQVSDIPLSNVVVEPTPKGSGPAIGLATAIVAQHEPDAIVGSFAADHDVRDECAFTRAAAAAIEAARDDWLVTIGLTPTRPETGYGYIERTNDTVVVVGRQTAYRAAGFHEKPALDRAVAYLESGRFLWNASMFFWKATTLLVEMARLQPDLHAGVVRIAEAWGRPEQERVMTEVWSTLPESTIDQGIMERATRVAVVPAAMGWSDIGDWHGLGTLIDQDERGNSAREDHVLLEAANCAVWSETPRLVAVVGLDDVVIVDTADALLVVNRSRAQDVRRIVDVLRGRARTDLI